MTRAEAEELFAYDRWATEHVFDDIAAMDPAEYLKNMATSHESIFGTLVHLVSAEEVWLARWEGRAPLELARAEDVKTLDRVRSRWNDVSRNVERFVSELDEEGLHSEIEVETSTGARFRHTFREMFSHLVNHSSYHRGQIITLLRQSGAAVTSTDLIRYYRER